MRAALLLVIAAADTCDLPALPSFPARPARSDSDCPRVYVYDIPQLYDYEIPWQELHKANVTQIFGAPCHDGILDEFDTNQYSLAIMILWRLATSERCGAVDDPKDADLYFVPTWPAAKGLPAWDRACGHPANAKVKHLPYLNERTAHRHFFIVGKGHVVPKQNCKYLCGNQILDAPRHRRDVVPVTASVRWRGASMAWSFHAIDTRLPRILRLLDGVQVDNLTHCLISTQASTGGCGRRGCWLARRASRTATSTGGRTRWRRMVRPPLTTRASRSNWSATASRMMVASPHTYLVCRTRRRSTPGALILDRGALILDRF